MAKVTEVVAMNRADYFREYNKRNRVRSLRLPPDLFDKIRNVVIQRGGSFNGVVIQLLKEALDSSNPKDDVVIQRLQQSKDYLIFVMDFFQRNADALRPRISPEDRIVFKEIAQFLREVRV